MHVTLFAQNSFDSYSCFFKLQNDTNFVLYIVEILRPSLMIYYNHNAYVFVSLVSLCFSRFSEYKATINLANKLSNVWNLKGF